MQGTDARSEAYYRSAAGLIVVVILALCGCEEDSSRHQAAPPAGGGDEGEMRMTFAASSLVYYADGTPRDLEVYPAFAALSVPEESRDGLLAWLAADPAVKKPVELTDLGRRGLMLAALADGVTAEGVFALIERLNATGFVRFASPVFGDRDVRTFVTDELLVRFAAEASVAQIEDLIAAHKTEITKKDFLWEKCYLLSFRAAGAANVLDAARLFHDSDLVLYAHPDFVTVMQPSWETVVREDFEGVFPSPGWSTYDANPADGEYSWGVLATADYPAGVYPDRAEAFHELFPSAHVAWCAASHDVRSPARMPGENCPQSWPVNMDARLVYGPFDLSASCWARIAFRTEEYMATTESDYAELLVSVDGTTWHGGRRWDGREAEWGGTFKLTRVPELGNVTGQERVWVALRFLSDGVAAADRWCKIGLFVDDIAIDASNLAPVEPLTSDPESGAQWGLRNVGQAGGVAGFDSKAPAAWSLAEEALGEELSAALAGGVIVAVIDEGIDLAHEDLNLIAGYDATYDPADEYRPDSRGGCNPGDPHGTACAGIVGARRNDVGVVGVAPGVRIMPVRVAYRVQGSWVTSETELAGGILWAARHGAKVLSNSWGGGVDTDVKHDAVREAKDTGCTVFFAAGNYGSFGSNSSVVYPARYEETVAVAAMSPCGEWKNPDSCDGERWGSCYGPAVDVAAPGVMIATTDVTGDGGAVSSDAFGHTGNYNPDFNGTSSACPHAAGVAALMLTVNPALTPDDVQELLESTAVDIGEAGYDEKTGFGLVNAEAAVRGAVARGTDLAVTAWAGPGTAFPGQTIATTLTVSNVGRFATGPCLVRVYLSADNRIDAGDGSLTEFELQMPAGGTLERSPSLTVPVDRALGAYFLIAALDADDRVAEGDEVNNLAFAALTLIHAPNLVVKPQVADFGTVVVGRGGERNIQIKNEGEGSLAPLTVTSITASGSAAFELDYVPAVPFVLGANEWRTLTVYFDPGEAGTYDGALRIASDMPGSPLVEIPLSGQAVAPAAVLAVTGVPVEFGETAVSRSFTIENRGDAALSWTLDVSAKPAWLTSVSPESGTTAVGESSSVTLTVSRNLMVPDLYTWDLPIASNGGADTVRVTMVVPAETLEVAPLALDFGPASTQASFTVRNAGGFALDWTVVRNLPVWLTVQPLGGTLPAATSEQVLAAVIRTGLAAGPYSHEIEIASNGGSARIAVTMEVPDEVPELSASGTPAAGVAPLAVEFTCDAAGGNAPLSFVWDFGDGSQSAALQRVTHVYESAGTYTAIATVTDADGDTDDAAVTVTVAPVLELTPAAASMDRAGDEREFTASGGTPPYVFDLPAAGEVADVVELEDHGDGTATVRVNPNGLLPLLAGSHSRVARVGIVTTEEYTFVVPPGDPIQADPIVPPDMTPTDPTFEVGSQAGVASLTVRVTDSSGAQATASVQFAALSGGWARAYGGADYEEAAALDLGTGGGVYATGNLSAANGDVLVMKVADDGAPLWQHAFGTTAVETGGYSVQATSDGGCIVSGASIHAYQAGAWIFKLDDAGALQWHKLYKGSSFRPCDVLQARVNGGYWIAGTLLDETLGQDVATVYRVDDAGEFLGVKHVFPIQGAFATALNDIDLTQDNGCIAAGRVLAWNDEVGDLNHDVAVIKINASGEAAWQRSYGLGRAEEGGTLFTYTEEARAIRATADGGYVVAAAVEGVASGGGEGGVRVYKAWILKLNASGGFNPTGTATWEKAFGAAGGTMFAPQSVIQTADGGYVVVGQVLGPTRRDAWIVKLDAAGAVLWQRSYGGAGDERFNAVREREDGALIVAGATDSFGPGGGANVWVLRLNADGTLGTSP